MSTRTVALLYQATRPPVIDGIAKPPKPGGYSDSGADIAYMLQLSGVRVVTPVSSPQPTCDFDWVWPDTASGIEAAMAAGANVLWANTVLFEGHPIQQMEGRVAIVGQSALVTQRFDDKFCTNTLLSAQHLAVARSTLLGKVACDTSASLHLDSLSSEQLLADGWVFPLVVKPVRGRGSEGVTLVRSLESLRTVAETLLNTRMLVADKEVPRYGDKLILEEFLSGDEITVTVMPPGLYQLQDRTFEQRSHWCLPVVRRMNHQDDVAPYNGTVAVTKNSVAVPEHDENDALRHIKSQCAAAASWMNATAPIRIDCRQQHADGRYVMFDVNMKPNATVAGRPGRDDQDSLCCMSALQFGWSRAEFLLNILATAHGK
eukprot:TRINITY_DN2287_c1_g1_i1.p2 TRINITY_DN2287_c1_g1~~TRINITY_DN2287_c1_g1_i1.p2  ORF type:complete len:374 (-),score=74.37 TRINITY_DN2287_c1_g1_i1:1268-2389(-)